MSNFTIRTAANKLGVSEMYIRKCVLEGKIETKQVYFTEKTWRHEITPEALEKFNKSRGNSPHRRDGRNKFVIYLTKAEEQKVRKLLESANMQNVAKLLGRANPPKSKK